MWSALRGDRGDHAGGVPVGLTQIAQRHAGRLHRRGQLLTPLDLHQRLSHYAAAAAVTGEIVGSPTQSHSKSLIMFFLTSSPPTSTGSIVTSPSTCLPSASLGTNTNG